MTEIWNDGQEWAKEHMLSLWESLAKWSNRCSCCLKVSWYYLKLSRKYYAAMQVRRRLYSRDSLCIHSSFIWLRFFVQNILVTWLWVSSFAFGRILYFGPFWSSQHLSWPRIHFFKEKIVHLWSCSMIGETEISVADDIFFGWISFLGARLVSIQYWNGCPSVLSWTSSLATRHLEICLLFFTLGTEQKSYRGFVLIFQIVICSLFQITFLRSFRGPYGWWTIPACITFGPKSA